MTARINITLQPEDLERIDTAATEQGLSRSEYMVRASLAAAGQPTLERRVEGLEERVGVLESERRRR